MTHINYTFLVGAPGSRWSGVGQFITENFKYNRSDESSSRLYSHGQFSGHKGAYWGPMMELGHSFHQLERTYGTDYQAFLDECDKAFKDQSGPKMIKCHQFAYGLDWLSQIPNSNILLVRRGDQECFDWWTQAGGWNISYPCYEWYVDDNHMKHYIETENRLADTFVKSNNAKWEPYTDQWIKDNFGTTVFGVTTHDIEVCLYE